MITSVSSSDSHADKLCGRILEKYGGDTRVFRAPGRVNLMGEHTDYNDGFVMPAAIAFYTWVAATKRDDGTLEVYSEHLDEKVVFRLDELAGLPRSHWSDYVRGVAAALQDASYKLSGANLLIHGEVPLGAGLSSSASLEVAIALALTSVSEITVPGLELVKLCQAAEHEYVGTRCGIMDQFVAFFGVRGHALMLDCRSLDYQLVPIPPDVRLVVCNSMVKHELASGEYNRRRADCESGAKLLQQHLSKVHALRDVQIEDINKYGGVLPERIYRRCRHVVTENRRVHEAAQALRANDLAQFGRLMYQSHDSLRDDFEVSCKELDLLVELALAVKGVYGSRMTGGGFGGSTVNLVRTDCVEQFNSYIAKGYREKTGIALDIYVCEPAQGAGAWPGDERVQV